MFPGPVDTGVGEVSRTVVPGVDPRDGSTLETILMVNADGTTDLHVPSNSRTVRLDSHAVAQLAHAMSPDGPMQIVISVGSRTGEWEHVELPVGHGRDLRLSTIRSLGAAMQAAFTRVKSGGWAPPARRAERSA